MLRNVFPLDKMKRNECNETSLDRELCKSNDSRRSARYLKRMNQHIHQSERNGDGCCSWNKKMRTLLPQFFIDIIIYVYYGAHGRLSSILFKQRHWFNLIAAYRFDWSFCIFGSHWINTWLCKLFMALSDFLITSKHAFLDFNIWNVDFCTHEIWSIQSQHLSRNSIMNVQIYALKV